jgi:signal transduction histidine kinase
VLDIVHEQSQVVGRILNDVLSLHKIEDGALTLQFCAFSLESMILSTMQSFQPGIHDKQIHYTAQLQTVQNFVFSQLSVEELQAMPHVDVLGDKYRLRQVLANFLSNAIKFTPTLGNVHVSLQIPRTAEAASSSWRCRCR